MLSWPLPVLMKKLIALLLLLSLLAAAAWAQPAVEPERQELFREIEEILADLSQITGLKPLKAVGHELIGKQRVKQFLEQRIKEEIKPEELRAEELTLKKFGFLPPEYDLKQATIDLITEQAAAFYDYRKKRLYVLDSNPSSVQQIALVHELAHALADQHVNLDKYVERAKQSDDGTMARLAVVEGQATWLMSEYMARRMGMSLKTSPSIVQIMAGQAGLAAGQFPVFDKAPLYLRETLLFPYTQGMVFQHAVFDKEGQAAFASVFTRPPASTQQVLHPEKYLAGDKPADPPLPALAAQGEYRVLAEGSVGELDHSILLRQYASREAAESVAPRWRGGSYRLLEHRKDGHTVLAYASEWADSSVAKEFFGLYRRVLKGKWRTMEVITEGDASLAGRGDDGYFLVRLDGSRLTSLEGMKSPGDAKESLR
jgi:hypothetical protein